MLNLHFKIYQARVLFCSRSLLRSPSKLSSSLSKLLLLHIGTFRDSFFSVTCSIEYLGLLGELVLTAKTFVCIYCKDLVCGTGAHFADCLGCSLMLTESHFD